MTAPAALPDAPAARLRDPLLLVALLAVYWATRQAGFYGDGIYYVGLVKGGIGAHSHVLYLPLFRGVRWLLHGLGDVPDLEILQALSVLPAAACGPLLWQFLRMLVPAATAGGVGLAMVLTLLAPAFWSFAGATENHAVNTACALWALTSAASAGVRSPFTALAWMAACGTHLTGVLLGPTLLLLDARRSERAATRTLRGFVLWGAVYLGLAAATFGIGLCIDPEPVKNYLTMLAHYHPDTAPRPVLEYLWEEGVVRAGLLVVLAAFGIVRTARRQPLLCVALALPLLLYGAAAVKVRAVEHGAYFVPLYPLLAALCLLGFDGARGRSVLLCAAGLQVLLGVQGWRLQLDPEEQAARELAPLVRRGDRVFFDLRDWKPMLYAEYYLGDAFDPLLTNLAALDPAAEYGREIQRRHHQDPDQALLASIEAALAAGGRPLVSSVLLADPARTQAPWLFLARVQERWHTTPVMAGGGVFLRVQPR